MTGRHVWGSGARRGQTIRRTLTGIAIATSVAMTGVTGIVLTPGVAHADVAPGVGPGSLDSSFGSSGKATYVLNGATLTADSNPVVVPGGSNAGKIVFVGHVASANPQTVYVVRLNADGSPDTTFGGASTPGAAATDFGLPSSFGAGPPTFMHGAVAVQPDGNIVVTGAKVTDSSGDTAIQVERLLGTTGALDATFGTAGARTVQLNTNSTNDHGDGVALLPSGKILISAWDGAGNTAASHARFAVIQLTSAGALDTASFGAGKGFAETSFSNQADDTSQAVAVQPDGHIVLAGFAKVDVGANTDGIGVVRYNSNGTLDPTFNGTGKVSTNISGGSGATGVVVDVKGEVSVAGFGSGQAMVARYTPGGALDSAFGSDPIVNMPGVQTFNFTGGSAVANGIVQDAQGRLLVTGVDNGSGNNDIGVARFNTNGDPANSNFPFDGLFGSEGGRESFNCPNTSLFQTLWGTGIAVPSDGRVLLLGQCAGPNSYNGNADQGVVVLRLNIDPLLNPKISLVGTVVPAGRKTVPLSSVTPSDASATLGDVLGGAFRGGAFRGGAFRGGAFRGGAFRGGAFRGGAFRGGAFRGGAFRGGPFAIAGLPPIQLSQAPLFAPKAWSDILPYTPYANVSPTDVTVQQMLTLTDSQVTNAAADAELNGLTMNDIDVSSTNLLKLSIAALLLGTVKFSDITTSTALCPYLAGQPQDCASPGTATIMAASPGQLELAGDTLAKFYKEQTIVLSRPAPGPEPVLDNSIILGTFLSDLQLDQTVMGSVLSSQAPTLVTCGTSCPGTTLADAQNASAGNIGPTARVDDLFALNAAGGTAAPAFTETLLDFLAGVIPPQNLPIETADIGQMIENAPPLAPTPSAHYGTFQIDVDLACYVTDNFRVDPHPHGDLRYVPGTATMTVDGHPIPVFVDSSNYVRPAYPGISCSPGALSTHVTVTVGEEAGPVLGLAPGFDAEISTGGEGGGETLTSEIFEGSTKADFPGIPSTTVVDGTEIGATPVPPANTVNAVTIPPDTLKLGHIYQPGVVQYFQVTPSPQPGSVVQVTLSHLPADYDLVVYGPPGVQLVTPESTSFSGGAFRGGAFRGGAFRGGGVGDNSNTQNAQNSITPPENIQDIPFLPNVPVRGVSANRGTQGESIQFVVQPNDPTSSQPFLIQISGYNGAFSPQPYVLKYSVTAPAPGLPCQARSYTGGGTAGALPTTAAGKQSLILVNEKRIGDIYGAAAETSTITELNKLAANSNVNGLVVPVEGDPTAAGAYNTWDGSPCDVQKANNVVSAISGVVQRLAATTSDLRWITIVGPDEVLPFGRIPDLGVQMNEQGYDTAAQNGQDNATSAALRAGYMLSDDPYGDFSPTPWFNGQLFVPQVAIGRLVETPTDIATQIDQFVALNGRLTPNAALTAGYDFFTPVAQAVHAAVTSQTASPVAANKATLFAPGGSNTNFSQSDAANAYLAAAATGGFISLNAHHDQYRAESAKDFNSPAPGSDPPFTTANLPASLKNSILFNMGCHAGLNIADVLVASPTAAQRAQLFDWPQATSSKGGVLQANTGFGEGDSAVMAYSMRLTTYFAQNLNGKMTLGQALMFAKQRYVNLGAPSVYDAKAIEQAAFYGLPQYRLGASGVAAPTAVPAPLPPPPTAVTASTQSVPFTNAGSTAISLKTAPDGTNYYQVGSQFPQVTPYEPVQPRAEIPLTDPAGQVAHGAIIESLTSTDHAPFNAHFDFPMDDRTGFTPTIQPTQSAFPSSLVGVDHTATPTGPTDTLVVTPGQYFTTPSGAVQRVFNSVGTTVEYSNSQDFTAPTISTVNANIHGTTAAFAVTTPSTGVTRAVILYFLKSTNTWTHLELTDTGHGLWAGVAQIAAGTTTVDAYFVQLLNAAGNVGVASNKGFDYSTTSAPTSAQDFTISLSASPNAQGTYPDGTAATIVPATGADPSLTFQTSIDGGAPVPGTGPFVLHGIGVHTVSVVDSNGLTQTEVIPIGSLTVLTANPATFKIQLLPLPSIVTFLSLSATLRDAQGHVLPGFTITFSAGSTVCTAVTNSSGLATCGGLVPLLSAILNLGYTATFAGSVLYSPSTSMGPLIQIS